MFNCYLPGHYVTNCPKPKEAEKIGTNLSSWRKSQKFPKSSSIEIRQVAEVADNSQEMAEVLIVSELLYEENKTK